MLRVFDQNFDVFFNRNLYEYFLTGNWRKLSHFRFRIYLKSLFSYRNFVISKICKQIESNSRDNTASVEHNLEFYITLKFASCRVLENDWTMKKNGSKIHFQIKLDHGGLVSRFINLYSTANAKNALNRIARVYIL